MAPSEDLFVALVNASGTVIDNEENPTDALIEDLLDSLYGRRKGAFVALVRDEGNKILFVTYQERGTYTLDFHDENRGDFENTDARLDFDDIVDLAISFANDDGSGGTANPHLPNGSELR